MSDNFHLVPDSWAWSRVDQAGFVQLGRQRSPQHHSGDHMRPYLRVANVYENRIDTRDVMEMNFTPAEAERFSLSFGDILLNEGQSRELVGRPAMFHGEVSGACFQNTLIRFKAQTFVDPRYALSLFRYYFHAGNFQNVCKWTTNIAHLGAERFASMPFPLAPLPEQKRIADKLDALLARVDACRGRLDRVPAILKRFRQSVLAAATSGELTREWREARGMEMKWPTVALDEVCDSIADGDHQAPPKADQGVPFITIGAINTGVLRLDEATRFVPESYFTSLKPERRAQLGDVLFSVTGSLGIPALVETTTPFVFQRHIAVLRPNPTRVSAKFLFHQLSADDIQRQAMEVATGTAQLTIPLRGLRAFTLALPSIAEQHEVVRRVESLFSLASTLERRSDLARARTERLTPSLLAKAFRGELVPQDPSDEPASVLLARLKGAEPVGAKKRKGKGAKA